jgi:hypothetical protein
MVRLQGFLARNGYPHQVLDPAEDADAKALVERYAPNPPDLPLAVCADGTVLKNPGTTDLARCLGMVGHDAPDRTYDVAIVGAGPQAFGGTEVHSGRKPKQYQYRRGGDSAAAEIPLIAVRPTAVVAPATELVWRAS